MLQKSGKPIILCVNKVDNIGALPPEFYEFYNLGLGDPIAVSSVHGHGTGDLLDEVIKNIPEGSFDDTDEDIVKVAVIGKPNVGKSSLINKISVKSEQLYPILQALLAMLPIRLYTILTEILCLLTPQV